MKQTPIYSGYLTTIHDEPNPVGEIGHGTHYSILEGDGHRFAIVWDRDHDVRIIHLVERLLFSKLLSFVLFIGERQGRVTVILHPDCREATTPEATSAFEDQLVGFAQSLHDPWTACVSLVSEAQRRGMVDDGSDSKISTYMQNICNLWGLAPQFTFDIA